MLSRIKLALLASAILLLSVPQEASAQTTQTFQISAQPLSAALLRLGRESGHDISFSPDLVRNKISHPVHAASLEAALKEMLTGSGLTYTLEADGSVTITAAQARNIAPSRPAAGGDPQDVETVVVTGARDVISSPGQIKLESRAIVDSITANELSNLPDMTLAESLDRIVGVSSDLGYNSSQPRTVTIRGFDARYNSMDIDGNPIWNASRNNRGTQLDVFPSSVVRQIDVYKTVLPDQDANSIGGHVELRTLRAFDGGSRPYFSVRGEIGHYDQAGVGGDSGPSYHLSGVGKDTFGPGNAFGFVLGADIQREKFYDIYNTVTGYSQINGIDVVNGSMFRGDYDKDVTRYAVYGKLEAQATNQLYAFLDVDYFDERNNEEDYNTGAFVTASAVTKADLGRGDFPKTTSEVYLESYYLNRATLIVGSGLDYRVGDLSAVTFRAGYTNYDHKENDAVGERFESPSITGSYDLGDTDQGVTINPVPGLDDPSDWVYRNKKVSYISEFPDNDSVYSAKLDYNYNTFAQAEGFGFAAGAYWRELNRRFNESQPQYMLPKGTAFTLADVIAPGYAVNGVSPTIIDASKFWNFIETNGTLVVNPESTADYHLVEDVYAGYAEATYAWGGLHALAGLRIEQTNSTDDTAEIQPDGSAAPETYQIDYTNLLPNAQVYYDIRPGLRVRAAYTKTIARPDFSDFAMGTTVSQDGNGNPVISGTNHFLKPRESSNYDASLEYYFDDGYVSLGAFYKNMHNEEFKQLTQTLDQAGNVILTETVPLNNGSASDRGLEFSFVKDRFGFLPAPFDGFGLSANYTRLDGKWHVIFTDGSSRTVDGLRNQPHWLGNLDLHYVWGPARVDVDWRFRGRTFTGTFGTNAAGDIWVADYTRLDSQISWKVLNNFTLYVAGRNLANAYWVQQSGIDDSLTTAADPGRSFWFGFKFKE